MLQIPKYKKALRQAIIEEVNSGKDVIALRIVFIIANLFRRVYGTNDEFNTLNEAERQRYSIIQEVLESDDLKLLKFVNGFIFSYLRESEERGKQNAN